MVKDHKSFTQLLTFWDLKYYILWQACVCWCTIWIITLPKESNWKEWQKTRKPLVSNRPYMDYKLSRSYSVIFYHSVHFLNASLTTFLLTFTFIFTVNSKNCVSTYLWPKCDHSVINRNTTLLGILLNSISLHTTWFGLGCVIGPDNFWLAHHSMLFLRECKAIWWKKMSMIRKRLSGICTVIAFFRSTWIRYLMLIIMRK